MIDCLLITLPLMSHLQQILPAGEEDLRPRYIGEVRAAELEDDAGHFRRRVHAVMGMRAAENSCEGGELVDARTKCGHDGWGAPSIHHKQPRPYRCRGAVRLRFVGHLIAHAGFQGVGAAVCQFGVEFA